MHVMYERFTPRAKAAVIFAIDAAKSRKETSFRPEHLFWGLVREGSGVGVTALKRLRVNLAELAMSVRQSLGEISDACVGTDIDDLIPSPNCHRVISRAFQEARTLGHNYVGTEHLLLVLMQEEAFLPYHMLSGRGVDIDRLRQEVAAVIAALPKGRELDPSAEELRALAVPSC